MVGQRRRYRASQTLEGKVSGPVAESSFASAQAGHLRAQHGDGLLPASRLRCGQTSERQRMPSEPFDQLAQALWVKGYLCQTTERLCHGKCIGIHHRSHAELRHPRQATRAGRQVRAVRDQAQCAFSLARQLCSGLVPRDEVMLIQSQGASVEDGIHIVPYDERWRAAQRLFDLC